MLTDRQRRALALLDLVERIEESECSVHIMAFDEKTGASAPVDLFHGVAAALRSPVQVEAFGPVKRHTIHHAGIRAYTLGGEEAAAKPLRPGTDHKSGIGIKSKPKSERPEPPPPLYLQHFDRRV